MKKLISLVLCLALTACLALNFTACSNKAPEAPAAVELADGANLGKGATAFSFKVVDPDGNTIVATVNTDKATVGEALVELGLVEGEESEWGLMVNTVNGITLDYNATGMYWAFFIDGEYAMTGVDSTDVVAGTTYSLEATKG